MKKHIEVIIMKQTVSEGFYVAMRGHEKNPNFKSFVTRRLDNYPKAYDYAHMIGTALALAGNTVEVLNDRYAEKDGNAYTEHMDYNNLSLALE